MTDFPERPFTVSDSEYPFDSHWFERDGAFMHYIDEGKGVPVIMLHGNPTWSFLYRNVIKRLDGSCRSIAVDYPGFGMSQHPPNYGYTPQEHAAWVNALIDYLSLERFVLVGQDWGGPIGLSIAVQRPGDVAGLVLGNTFAWRSKSLTFYLFATIAGGPIGKYLILRRNFFADRLMSSALTRSESKSPDILKAYTEPFPTPESRMGTYVFPRALKRSDELFDAINAGLGKLDSKPVELLMGTQDTLLASDEVIDRWLSIFPDAGLERVEDAGHYFQEDRPDRVAAAIRRLLVRS
ncbi:MAG: alpha/beta fold hydrolase [Chloroflexota bacterium]|nr:MAG: alpha/beta fold hydrolase [Chloroflexota bacterium]